MANLKVIELISYILQELLPPFIYKLIVNPVASRAAFFLFLGIAFAEGFGKKLDQGIVASVWFDNLKNGWWILPGGTIQGIVKRLLDVMHHWWIGWGMMIKAVEMSGTLVPPDLWYFGLGLLIDDIKDIPYRYGWKER